MVRYYDGTTYYLYTCISSPSGKLWRTTGEICHNIPAGGTASQALVKIDGTDYNVQWSTIRDVPSIGSAASGWVLTIQSDNTYLWQQNQNGARTHVVYDANALAADGDISYTGVGFKPTAIVMTFNVDGNFAAQSTAQIGDGIHTGNIINIDGTGHLTIHVQGTTNLISWGTGADTGFNTFVSFDTDGFTIHSYSQNLGQNVTVQMTALCIG